MRTAKVLLLGALLLPRVSAGAREESFNLVEGVVVDNARQAVHLMRPDGGIESVSIAAGTTHWTSEEADKPLGIRDGALVAQVEVEGVPRSLEIATLDAASGALGQRSEAALPAGVWGGIDEGLGRSFSSRLVSGASGSLVVWEYRSREAKGIAPAPDELVRTPATGAYSLDPVRASLQPVPLAAVPLAAAAPEPPASAATWAAAHPAAEAPVEVEDLFAATEVTGDMSAESGRITLKRWNGSSGLELPDVELHRGPHILLLRSADGRHLLITERVEPGHREEYEWSIFSLETGARVGQLRSHRSHGRFFIQGSTIVFVDAPFVRREGEELVHTPRRVRAAVLGSGSLVWERDLRDTAYRGPSPP